MDSDQAECPASRTGDSSERTLLSSPCSEAGTESVADSPAPVGPTKVFISLTGTVEKIQGTLLTLTQALPPHTPTQLVRDLLAYTLHTKWHWSVKFWPALTPRSPQSPTVPRPWFGDLLVVSPSEHVQCVVDLDFRSKFAAHDVLQCAEVLGTIPQVFMGSLSQVCHTCAQFANGTRKKRKKNWVSIQGRFLHAPRHACRAKFEPLWRGQAAPAHVVPCTKVACSRSPHRSAAPTPLSGTKIGPGKPGHSPSQPSTTVHGPPQPPPEPLKALHNLPAASTTTLINSPQPSTSLHKPS